MIRTTRLFITLLALFAGVACFAGAQSLSKIRKVDIQTGHEMIRVLKEEVPKNFIDPGFFGVDLQGALTAADTKLDKAESLAQVYGIIAQPLFNLNDPHTFFIPPKRNARLDYGFQMRMIGDKAFVTAVSPASDAAKKGLKAGDEIISVTGFTLTRGNIWKYVYINYIVRPGTTPQLVVKGPDGKEKKLAPSSKVTQNEPVLGFDATTDGKLDSKNMINWVIDEARMRKHRFEEIGDLIIWKAPHFDMNETTMNGLMGSVRKKGSLVLDLRENVGGHEENLERLAGLFLDHEVKICDFQGRKPVAPLMARGSGDCFKGKVVILTDSATSGAAELLARFLQLEKRATVIGDVTAGSVLRARLHRFDMGENPFAASISEAAPVMSDGVCIERVGVTPDELVLPTAQDLADSRDPVLSRAAKILGVELDPVKAGALFPIEWHLNLLKE
ncbi:MAG: hypothetical protein EHM61_18235 [Acidobacteria bacterium]|nr:MAG: hypothetical protein EHM61_18235 [Acidobacteriota bacterium]